MNDDIHETPSTTPNFQTELAAQLAELVPEAIADGKIDVVKLQELLAADAADANERFGLFWPGKKRSLRAAQEPTTATLRPDPDNSKDWDTTKNIFIEGDNLEVLKILQKHYHNKVKLIYIDPPYNTGKDFVYPDNYREGLDTYLEWTKQVNEGGKKVTTNAETEGRYHSNWLSMMYPRLKLARNLLTDDGTIFVSISDHEVDNLRKLLNDVFGESNYVGQIAVSKGTTTGQDANDIGSSIDFLLVYARSKANYIPNGLPLDEQDMARFNQEDDRGRYSVLQFRKTGTNDRREDRPNLYYALEAPDGSEVYPIGPGGYDSCWRTARAQFDAWDAEGMIVWKQDADGNYKPYVKYYLEGRTKQVSNYWDDIEGNKKASLTVKELLGKNVFTNPKPVGLIKKILHIATDSDSVVLDFFSGSATTAHAVMELNSVDGGRRQHIQVQLPEPTPPDSAAEQAGYQTIAEVSRKRVDLAGTKILATKAGQLDEGHGTLDVGFRAYTLSDTNFSKWRATSGVEANALEQHLLDLRDSSSADDATPDDLLTEILLKQGYSLTEKIAPVEIDGLELRAVYDSDGDFGVLAYLDEHTKPSLEQLRNVVGAGPARMIILEDAFQGDDELKTNLVQLAKSKSVELWTA
ncbi:MAG: site-specific DNA-methyltransferase [Microbacterium sp.]|uniref:site-specific DNA-methyltransferase n=1 Tax=Microbacterium sp. TaxID=51671 RepID=UPI001AD55C5F|nr:site-specific DNA-methyltransferase [Microbacterium sp.]MBN9177370.1 site-specific DNA-methyltransferase [Microbacterium sp.]